MINRGKRGVEISAWISHQIRRDRAANPTGTSRRLLPPTSNSVSKVARCSGALTFASWTFVVWYVHLPPGEIHQGIGCSTPHLQPMPSSLLRIQYRYPWMRLPWPGSSRHSNWKNGRALLSWHRPTAAVRRTALRRWPIRILDGEHFVSRGGHSAHR